MDRRKFIQSASLLLTVPSISLAANNLATKNKIFNTDIVIIGSGPAGLSLAQRLSQTGVKVTVIESGPLEGVNPQAQNSNTVLDAGHGLPYPLGFATKRMVGGTSAVWGGRCPRLQPDDLVCHSKFGYAVDWPISYKEIEQHYCDAERLLQVFSSAKNCTTQKLNDTSYAWTERLKNEGLSNTLPASVTLNGKGEYEPLRLKQSLLPELIEKKNFSILQNVTARSFEIDKLRNANAVLCTSNTNTEIKINCKTIVICCGAIQSARLLMLHNQKNPNLSIGAASGELGANFMDHPVIRMKVTEKTLSKKNKNLESFPTNISNTYGQAHIWEWYGKFRNEKIGAYLPLAHQNMNSDSPNLPSATKNSSPAKEQKTSTKEFYFSTICEQEPLQSNRFELSTAQKDYLGDPLVKLWYKPSDFDKRTKQHANNTLEQFFQQAQSLQLQETSFALGCHHLMGTTRMANNESQGVVDNNLKVFGSNNIYVLGGSVFPSGGAANPTLTIVALALRLAEHLRNQA